MRNVTITINATISIKVNDDAKAKHHHDNKSNHPTTNFSSDEKLPNVKILPSIKGHVIKDIHPDLRDEMFFVHGEHETITAHELIIRDGKIFALDTSTLKGIEAKSAATTYGTIVPDGKGGLKLFSDHGQCYPCSAKNGVYTMDDVLKWMMF